MAKQNHPMTNVFALCELRVLEWRVYAADVKLAETENMERSAGVGDAAIASDKENSLTRNFQRMAQRNMLCVLDSGGNAQTANPMLWLFIVNDKHPVPSADLVTGAHEIRSGVWKQGEDLPVDVQTYFFQALNGVLTTKLLSRGEFLIDDGYFQRNEAKFIYRCPSLVRLNHFEIYLEEDFPMAAFQCHFQVLQPSHLLCVTVKMAMKERYPSKSNEVGNLESSWQRLMGLPTIWDHSVVDVWHVDDGLVPRIIAETKYSDVYPRFRSVAKRKHKPKNEDGDMTGNEGDDGNKKAEENEDDGDDDDGDEANNAEADTDGLMQHSANSVKRKRKKTGTDPAENDDSITPVSPDTHANTPEASGPIIQMTFPHDEESYLHPGTQVHRFKRRRNRTDRRQDQISPLKLTFGSVKAKLGAKLSASTVKSTSSKEFINSMRCNGVNSAQFLAQYNSVGSKTAPTNSTLKSDLKPTLSVAVSLVESLSHSEQQEALDARPVKTHPLLKALQAYVEKESRANMTSEMNGQNMKLKMLPNAEMYTPVDKNTGMVRFSVNHATSDWLQTSLLSDRFEPWRSHYSPYPCQRKSRQHKRDRQRELVLGFDNEKFVEYSHQLAIEASQRDQHAIRDEEISLGIQMAASDALVGWRQSVQGMNCWSDQYQMTLQVADDQAKMSLAGHVRPYLQTLQSYLVKASDDSKSDEVLSQGAEDWLSFEDFARALGDQTDARASMNFASLEIPPKFCVSTLESSYNISPFTISEYLLRNFHPMAAPKPVDYVIVCPHSPSEWLGTLVLSYFTCFRSVYAQCNMGDQAPIELSHLEGNNLVTVDAMNAMLLVECAESTQDAFATYRAAGELLNPVLSTGVKKKQAFSRSAVANVVYLTVPFRRQDMRHKMWAVGAFYRGLYGSTSCDVDWRESVTLELLYLDDLYEVAVNPSPFILMSSCFGLYDRVCENVNLKPAVDKSTDVASSAGRARFVSERLYHLANWRNDDMKDNSAQRDTTQLQHIYGSYKICDEEKWLAFSCTDAVGSLLETAIIPFDSSDLDAALLKAMKKWLDFLALFGERSMLVIARLGCGAAMPKKEQTAWANLFSKHRDALLPTAYEALLCRIQLIYVNVMPCEQLQVRENSISALSYEGRRGYVIVSLNDTKTGDRSRITTCVRRSESITEALDGKKETVVISVVVVQEVAIGSDDESASYSSDIMKAILMDFYALSYLTMHPVTLKRQSPLPIHLTAINILTAELRILQTQLTTDPLQLR